MNQQPTMYGSTAAACSINIPSTSNLAQPQQATAGAVPNAPMYYVPQISTDPYGQQIIQYGDSYGQETIYPSKDMYASPTNTYARLPNAYSYNNAIPSGQNDFASNIAPQFQPQPLGNQNSSAQIIPQQQSQFAGQQRPVVNMMPALKAAAYQKRGPEQTYQINYSNNSVPAFNSPTAPYPPQLNQSQQQKIQNSAQNGNGNGINNGQDQRNSRLSTMFDNTLDNYTATASWVSSTSSIPADQKIPPDQGSRHNSPTSFEFSNWNAELPKMNETSAQNPTMASVTGQQQQQMNVQQQIQPTHAYAGQPPQFPTTTPSAVPQMAYYAPNQPQFAPPPNVGYYQMTSPYIPPQYVLPNALPMAIPNYTTMPVNFGHQQFVSPALALHQPPLNPLWSPDARPLDNNQDSRFENTWLDQNKCTQQELDIQREVIPFALEHNSRQYNAGHSGSRNGLLCSIIQPQQSLNGGGGNETGHRKPYNNKRGGNNYRTGGGNNGNVSR